MIIWSFGSCYDDVTIKEKITKKTGSFYIAARILFEFLNLLKQNSFCVSKMHGQTGFEFFFIFLVQAF